MHKIWFSERLQEFHWVLHIEGSSEHYSGNAPSLEQVMRDIEICKVHHTESYDPH